MKTSSIKTEEKKHKKHQDEKKNHTEDEKKRNQEHMEKGETPVTGCRMDSREVKRVCSLLNKVIDDDQIIEILSLLESFVPTRDILTTTPLPRVVGKLRKHHHEAIKSRATKLVKRWKDEFSQVKYEKICTIKSSNRQSHDPSCKSAVLSEVCNPMKRTVQVCILVPKPRSANRKIYESLPIEPAQRRRDWYRICVGSNGVYVGRPKCDGGWYHVPEVKHGSRFANPFALKDYSVTESLELFAEYLRARMDPNATVEKLIPLFPEKLRPLLKKRFVMGKQNEAKSVSHYDLVCCGDPFRKSMMDLRGRRLACWCENQNLCHAGVLADVVDKNFSSHL